jgi:tetratricopeptide (TPR) repeat protein
MDCLFYMTKNVYDIWARYEESLSNYQSLLEYYASANDSYRRSGVLNNIALIYSNKGEYEQALKLYNQSLEISRGIGDQYAVGTTLNNMAVALIKKEKYEESLFYVLQAYTILQRLHLPRDLHKQFRYKAGREGYDCSNFDADCDDGLQS